MEVMWHHLMIPLLTQITVLIWRRSRCFVFILYFSFLCGEVYMCHFARSCRPVCLISPGQQSIIKISDSQRDFQVSVSWWRHQMETFFALLAVCAGNSPVTGEFPTQRPVTRSFDVFFDLRLNKQLSKQSSGWWFETPPSPLWRHCNVLLCCQHRASWWRGTWRCEAIYRQSNSCPAMARVHYYVPVLYSYGTANGMAISLPCN